LQTVLLFVASQQLKSLSISAIKEQFEVSKLNEASDPKLLKGYKNNIIVFQVFMNSLKLYLLSLRITTFTSIISLESYMF